MPGPATEGILSSLVRCLHLPPPDLHHARRSNGGSGKEEEPCRWGPRGVRRRLEELEESEIQALLDALREYIVVEANPQSRQATFKGHARVLDLPTDAEQLEEHGEEGMEYPEEDCAVKAVDVLQVLLVWRKTSLKAIEICLEMLGQG